MVYRDHWLAPKWVSTPDLLADVERYCGISFTDEEFASLPIDLQRKLRLVTERLEFVEHLLVLREFVERMQRREEERRRATLDNGQEGLLRTINYSFILWGHELAGAHFDIEALVFYLLLTIIDTIKGQSTYINPFDWLVQPNNLQKLINLQENHLREQLEALKREHRANFGLSKRFIEAFTNDLPAYLRNKFITCVAVVKVKDGKVNSESLQSWEAKSEGDKIKKIAEHLYQIRSSFTHASMRTFLPTVPLSSNPELSGKQLLCRPGCSLLSLIRESIKALIRVHFSP